LRRYVDLINQWQLVAALGGGRAPFGRSSESLLSALRAYEVATARYDEHQRMLEHYWCLRYLEQERLSEVDAVVVRENLARFERLPLSVRVPSMPELAPGTRVRLEIVNFDLLERSLDCRWRATDGQSAA
jgi:exoribonuclease-2